MNNCSYILQAIEAACGDFLRELGGTILPTATFPQPEEQASSDMLRVVRMKSMTDMRTYYNIITIVAEKQYNYRFCEDPFLYSKDLEKEIDILYGIGRNIADQLCHAILKNTTDIGHNTLKHIQLYNDLMEELECCPECLADWLLEDGLRYHVAKNFLVSVTDQGDNGYTMSNARVQMLEMGRNHLCSAYTAEHHS